MKFRYSADVEFRERMHDEYRSAKRNLRKDVTCGRTTLITDLFSAGDTHDPAVEWTYWTGFQEENKVLPSEVVEAIASGGRNGCPVPSLDVSFDAATFLARTLPWELLAAERHRIYSRLCNIRRHGDVVDDEAADIYAEKRVLTQRQWALYLGGDSVAGVHTESLQCCRFLMSGWRVHGVVYHMTQILTGHGCFGTYLARIGKVPIDLCEHCGSGVDSSEYTLLTCVAWSAERAELVAVLGPLASIRNVVAEMGKRKKRSHSREKENKELWKRLKILESLVESRLPVRQPLRELVDDHSTNPDLTKSSSHISHVPFAENPGFVEDSNLNEMRTDTSEMQVSLAILLDTPQIHEASVLHHSHSVEHIDNRPLSGQELSSQPDTEEILDLDDEILKIIGEEPLLNQSELKIHVSLANRWNPWLQQGLKKEVRD
ncbi:hypothetical protein DMN91_000859 [Ooceraea biroi]|uniref:Uncharacterized protein n=1 Tax=Ooceraea biroi TaxID=2015173 RepID=A0A3L8E2U4_OOCBI|nr:hypothetical protein DMN91_000859 [Ooceraea biroi]